MEEQEIDLEGLLRIIREEKLESLVTKPDQKKKRTLENKESISAERAKIFLKNQTYFSCASFDDYLLLFKDYDINNYEIGNFEFMNKDDLGTVINIFDFWNLFQAAKEKSLEDLLVQGISFSEISKLQKFNLHTLRRRIIREDLIDFVTAPDKLKEETLETNNDFAKVRLRLYIRQKLKNNDLIHGYSFGFATTDINDFSKENILVFANTAFKGSKSQPRECLSFDEFIENIALMSKVDSSDTLSKKARAIKTLIEEGKSLSYIINRLNISEKTFRNYINEYNLNEFIISPDKEDEETQETDVVLANFRVRLYLKALFEKNNIDEIDFSRKRIVFFDNDINNYELDNLILVSVLSKDLSNSKKVSDYFQNDVA